MIAYRNKRCTFAMLHTKLTEKNLFIYLLFKTSTHFELKYYLSN